MYSIILTRVICFNLRGVVARIRCVCSPLVEFCTFLSQGGEASS